MYAIESKLPRALRGFKGGLILGAGALIVGVALVDQVGDFFAQATAKVRGWAGKGAAQPMGVGGDGLA